MAETRKVAGRPRKYATATAFQNAVNRYFLRTSRVVGVTEQVPTGRFDQHGHMICEERTVKNQLGETATRVEYLQKPSVAAICTEIGISRDTWNEYERREGYDAVCAAAKLEIERYLVERLGSGKGDSGVMFNLKQNYGWKDRMEVEAGPQTRQTIAGGTTAEKVALLRELGLRVPGEHDETDAG